MAIPFPEINFYVVLALAATLAFGCRNALALAPPCEPEAWLCIGEGRAYKGPEGLPIDVEVVGAASRKLAAEGISGQEVEVALATCIIPSAMHLRGGSG